jgi:hypothetical protein
MVLAELGKIAFANFGDALFLNWARSVRLGDRHL